MRSLSVGCLLLASADRPLPDPLPGPEVVAAFGALVAIVAGVVWLVRRGRGSGSERRVRLRMKDTMAFYSHELETFVFDPEKATTTTWWFRVPRTWLEKGRLRNERYRHLYDSIYGGDYITWRDLQRDIEGGGEMWEEEGAMYYVLEAEARALKPAEEAKRPWLRKKSTLKRLTEDGQALELEREAF